MKKYFKYVFLIIIIGIIGIWFFVFYLPKTDIYRSITVKKSPPISANEIAKDFLTNENTAFAKYSGKQIEVSGVVKQTQIENGKTAIYLNTADEFTSIYFLLKDSMAQPNVGENITIKGICTGYLGDVQFNEGEIVK